VLAEAERMLHGKSAQVLSEVRRRQSAMAAGPIPSSVWAKVTILRIDPSSSQFVLLVRLMTFGLRPTMQASGTHTYNC
jgi:hypothetical protein